MDEHTTKSRLIRNPYTDITVWDEEQLVGYISICPVTPSMFDNIIKQNVTEEEIEQGTVSYEKPNRYVCYLSSIVIDKELYPYYKGQWLFSLLEQHLLKLRKRGIFISEIVAVSVSIGGRKSLERFGFQEIKPNIFIYHMKHHLPSFIRRIPQHGGLYSLLQWIHRMSHRGSV